MESRALRLVEREMEKGREGKEGRVNVGARSRKGQSGFFFLLESPGGGSSWRGDE
jgi:hypothetical protein